MSSDGGSSLDQSISAWVDSFIVRQDAVYDFLEDIDRVRLYDPDECRDRIRSFANGSGGNRSFPLIMFSLIGRDAFFEDVSEVVSDDIIADLRALSEEFSHLEEDFRVVFREEFDGEVNPITDNSAMMDASVPNEDPFVRYELLSGSVKALETRMRPSDLLHLSATAAYSASLPHASDDIDPELSEDEMDAIVSEVEHIEDHLSDIYEWIDGFDGYHDMTIDEFEDEPPSDGEPSSEDESHVDNESASEDGSQ